MLRDKGWCTTDQAQAAEFAGLAESRSDSQGLEIWRKTNIYQCDRTKPACNNCIRRKKSCPGYSDAFDGKHRPQNQVVRRHLERQTRARDAGHSTKNSAASTSENIAGLITADSSSSATTRSKTSPKWVVYCPENDRASSARQAIDSPAGTLPGVMVQKDSIDFKSSIPCSLRQDGLDASICFFFRHYAGTAFDPEALGFNQLWQPMYLRAATQSSLRLATAAVTVNIAMMQRTRFL